MDSLHLDTSQNDTDLSAVRRAFKPNGDRLRFVE